MHFLPELPDSHSPPLSPPYHPLFPFKRCAFLCCQVCRLRVLKLQHLPFWEDVGESQVAGAPMENGPEHRGVMAGRGGARRGRQPEAELTVGEDETKRTPWTERLRRNQIEGADGVPLIHVVRVEAIPLYLF